MNSGFSTVYQGQEPHLSTVAPAPAYIRHSVIFIGLTLSCAQSVVVSIYAPRNVQVDHFNSSLLVQFSSPTPATTLYPRHNPPFKHPVSRKTG